LAVCLLVEASLWAAQPTSVPALIRCGHWKRARALVETRLREAPNDASSNFYLSQIRNAFGDHATPLELAEKAVALDPNVARYHRQVAEVLGVMAQHSNAFQQLFLARRFRREIDKALALDPRDTQALRDLVEFYLLAPGILGGDRRKAEATAERIAAINPAEACLARARIAASENRTADDEAWLQKAAAAQPPNYRTRVALAQFYLAPEHLNLRGAESQARDAMRLDGGRVEAYAVLAAIYAHESRWSELDAVLDTAAREVPDDPVAYYRAAQCLIDARRDEPRAERYLRVYLAQPPEGNEPTLAEAQQQLDRIVQNAAPRSARAAGGGFAK
jgi:tetratricopeptide (TPR) repeat protein